VLESAAMALSEKNDWADGILSEVETQRDPTEVYTMSKEDLEGELMEEAAEAMVELEIAKESRKTWARRRKTGARKLGASAQSFLSNASAFIASYSGIVELVKAADQQYGGLAYGTLSLFLSVRTPVSRNGYHRLTLKGGGHERAARRDHRKRSEKALLGIPAARNTCWNLPLRTDSTFDRKRI
jgi:hypothetical protein